MKAKKRPTASQRLGIVNRLLYELVENLGEHCNDEKFIRLLESIGKNTKLPAITRKRAKNAATKVLLRIWKAVVANNNQWFNEHKDALLKDPLYCGRWVLIRGKQIIETGTTPAILKKTYRIQEKEGRFISVIRFVGDEGPPPRKHQ